MAPDSTAPETVPEPLRRWLERSGRGRIARVEAVGGGCVHRALRLFMDRGGSLFAKCAEDAPEGLFESEAAGLAALAGRGALRVPAALHAERRGIVMENLGRGEPGAGYWSRLGEGLAALHREAMPRFGFDGDNWCGATPQSNAPDADGHAFFARRRILPLARAAFERGLADRAALARLERIADGLPRWIPPMPAALIHGDLWSGNVHCAGGEPALVDPAAHWGWAEAELAMTVLFGGFPREFHDSYARAGDMAPDWRERAPLYNLYHLLNHLLMFGGGYLEPVLRICARYAS